MKRNWNLNKIWSTLKSSCNERLKLFRDGMLSGGSLLREGGPDSPSGPTSLSRAPDTFDVVGVCFRSLSMWLMVGVGQILIAL